jgi:16S rRNA (adenine1518-N6/adenine1519-N6)-dimethyltransferase
MEHRAKKSLGQHFLTSSRVIERIISFAQLSPGDTVLEIGPGKGVLTRALLSTQAKVVAVEKDTDLIPHLATLFAAEIQEGRLTLVEADILAFDPKECGFFGHDYKLVANIPYYITGEIMRRFLSETIQPAMMVLLIQKEVAERIVAKDGKESILSLSVKLYGKPRLALRVPKRYFKPIPNVDSAVLVIDEIGSAELRAKEEARFFELVKLGFSQKRKQLLPLLSTHIKKETVSEMLARFELPITVRAEDMPLAAWIELAKRT